VKKFLIKQHLREQPQPHLKRRHWSLRLHQV
jgi:hypothetical protein